MDTIHYPSDYRKRLRRAKTLETLDKLWIAGAPLQPDADAWDVAYLQRKTEIIKSWRLRGSCVAVSADDLAGHVFEFGDVVDLSTSVSKLYSRGPWPYIDLYFLQFDKEPFMDHTALVVGLAVNGY